MDEYDDLKITDSEDDEGAGERVRMVMEEIYKNQDKIKSEKDIDEMAERCTKMMTQMRNETYSKKKDKKGHRASGSGDKATPPPSRVSLKESPRKDSTKPTTSQRLPPSVKAALKEQLDSKKKPSPNFTELYKEKMDKLKVPKVPPLNKMDSTKMSKAKVGMGDSRRKTDKVVEEPSSESESESSTVTSESESPDSGELQQVLDASRTYDKMMKDMKARESFRSPAKEVDAHKKAADWMSSTRGEQTKKKEGAGGSKPSGTKTSAKISSFYSSSESDSEAEKMAQQLKSKMTMSSKKPTQDSKDALRKLMASMSEKPVRASATAAKAPAPPIKKPPGVAPGAKVALSRPGPADKAKPKKKI